ncbi:Holliday junction branch migration protein RuvA [Wandonia haliotis]|uniref:Holliday junction branch migration complex subunit RuvA n=1 Tax=Wandonia haliotis TaxID=574963 RepID=A0ABP3Y118_9FLAO
MITHLRGRLIEKNPTHLVIECAGVGYAVKISLNTYATLSSDENIFIYTHQIFREDAQILFGFHSIEEREMFNHLISVSGIGPNTAILMLSALSPEEIAHAIQTEDVKTIKSIKGIGAKTAERVIIDLRDKVVKMEFTSNNIFTQNNTKRFEALTALIALGFDKKIAEKALDKVAASEEDTVEVLIREALKIL